MTFSEVEKGIISTSPVAKMFYNTWRNVKEATFIKVP